MKLKVFIFLFSVIVVDARSQNAVGIADSFRLAYRIPELGYAVVSSDSVLELQVCGEKKIHSGWKAEQSDRFRIGSNTKAITGFIAAQLVKEKKIAWNTKFFDLFPEMKKKSDKKHWQLTLVDLLSFRTKLYPYTYTYDLPKPGQFKGDEAVQRYQFAQYFFSRRVTSKDTFNFSNLGYIAAGLMLEKVSGKSYKELVTDLGEQLNIDFGFGSPNQNDSLQTWGHDKDLIPEPPQNNYKLNWLLPAGNINVSLPGYLKFIQLQLRGLNGRSEMLSREEFNFLHFGLNRFAVGWFVGKEENGEPFSYNTGNPGTFYTKVFVYPQTNRAYIVFANAQTDGVTEGTESLMAYLKGKYER